MTIKEGVKTLSQTDEILRDVTTFLVKKLVLPKSLQSLTSEFTRFFRLEEIEFHEDCEIKELPNFCFNSLSQLRKVILPKNLEVIGSNAFKKCDALREVKFPTGNLSLGTNSFDCGLREVSIECQNLKLDTYAFHLSTVKNVKIRVLGDSFVCGTNVFEGCKSLKSAIIEAPNDNSKGSSLRYWFSGCKSLEKVILNCNFEVFSIGTFAGCEALREVTLPKTLKRIGMAVFNNCNSLEFLELPESLEQVTHESSFEGMSSRTIIRFLNKNWSTEEFTELIKTHNNGSELLFGKDSEVDDGIEREFRTLRDCAWIYWAEELAVLNKCETPESLLEETNLF